MMKKIKKKQFFYFRKTEKIDFHDLNQCFFPFVGCLFFGLSIFCAFYFRSVSEIPVYPLYQCPFNYLTGYWCPGCGLSRSFVLFAHGEWSLAMAYQPFIIILFPMFIWYFVKSFCKLLWNLDPIIGFPPWGIMGIFILFMGYGIFRLIASFFGLYYYPT